MLIAAKYSPRPRSSEAASCLQLCSRPSIEITGAESSLREVIDSDLPAGSEVFIAFVPGESVDRVVEVARRVAKRGLKPTPHVIARSIKDEQALARILDEFAEVGVDQALVLAGDRPQPEGRYHCALQLVETGRFSRAGFNRLYFALHPEGHPVASPVIMRQAMIEKLAAARADGIEPALVSQFVLDAEPLIKSLADLPPELGRTSVRIGLAGPASSKTLLKYALYCGVGVSLKALGSKGATLGQVVLQESPEPLIRELAATLEAPVNPLICIDGLHFFTFGSVSKTMTWINDFRARLLD